MTINFNPSNAYWEEAIQQQLDARAEQENILNAFCGATEILTEHQYDYDALSDAFADIPEEEYE